jgi:hypothetical protein
VRRRGRDGIGPRAGSRAASARPSCRCANVKRQGVPRRGRVGLPHLRAPAIGTRSQSPHTDNAKPSRRQASPAADSSSPQTAPRAPNDPARQGPIKSAG